MPSNRRESGLQQAIMEQLAIHGWRAEAFAKPGTHRRLGGVIPLGFPDVVAFKGRDDQVNNYGQGGLLHHFTSLSLRPDVRCLLIEVKTPKGTASHDQKDYHTILQNWGIPVHVVRSLEDIWALLEAAGERVKRVEAR